MSEDSSMKPCALLFGNAGTIIAATPNLGLRTKIKTQVETVNPPSADSYFGFHLTVRRDRRQLVSEDEGNGVCFSYDPSLDEPVLADFRITVKFPRGGVSCDYLPVPEDRAFGIVIQGYAQEYYNSPDPKLEAWARHNGKINNVSLLDVLQQRDFYFVVEMDIGSCREVMGDEGLSPRFTYGYPRQPTNVEEMKNLVNGNQGGAFTPCYNSLDNDDSFITAINQSVVQDNLWLQREAEVIAQERLQAYFVAPPGNIPPGTGLNLLVSVPEKWKNSHELALRHSLMSNALFKVKIYDVVGSEDPQPALWVGKIIERGGSIPELDSHLTGDNELVLRVRTAAEPQNSVSLVLDSGMEEVKRRVKGMRAFRSNAPPTNPRAWGMAVDAEGEILAPHLLDRDQMNTASEVLFKMRVHRAVLRGTGFYEAFRTTQDLRIGCLPAISYTRHDDPYLIQQRALNIGIIIGETGSGKTTLGVAAALAMEAKLGKILCSGPSNASIDLFASRRDTGGRAVAARYNTILPAGHPDRRRHHLVIRMYAQNDEMMAIAQVLNNPQAVDWAQNMGEFFRETHWKMHLSLAYWTLAILRSNAVPALDADCKLNLRTIQSSLDNDASVSPLRQVARGHISWAQYTATPDAIPILQRTMCRILRQADFLCVHPAEAEISPLPLWKSLFAKGLVVDDAGKMNRADFYGLWGNTLLPIFLIGDPGEKPVVLTIDEADENGNLLNRFAADGAISPLKFLVATGIPVFRL
ncbi:uncharacterized protein FFUJ_11822 [Fusarium fujikuroi IMI 58289]|uniref:DNA2/NAM7 helicase helicase domain-containing protein n=1 Tax=Gibberella fujikuroi (strain CBS 195.34 / IMI 58289 / NRRL A-6831) TaxID=1279085 RepID=S0ENQ8_GIBF5|nr:uncharacterized protein FFUJ_11822 [Fusarium fujikuroi IMI 58289]KLP22914.1 uncharacterized protein LW94_1433 [Fusarium fujikuroi]CCT75784.1 uncharacterized protein FFUJ_11822 [Fusarium fujikuroi IMI 58289]SCO14958.1 uncharacterized protein FFC1_12334 [Fusarium fujikuroi]SCO57256.1 uncharacterized protein FFMR_14412 [Fusarium fujikuroi]SCV54809.1 uncharacterized protein FFFS_11445 [Fusarium fujikuroi]